MGESAAAASADGEASESTAKTDGPLVVDVAEAGDIILDLTFQTSVDTISKERKARFVASRKARPAAPDTPPPFALRSKVKVAYRVSLQVLKRHSQYFSHLLSNSQFREAALISDAHQQLAARGIKPGEAAPEDLPWISITDDDEATKVAGREYPFEDLLRIIHEKPHRATNVNISYITTMAITADRFDCIKPVSRYLNTQLKFKWPLTNNRALEDENGRPTDTEQVIRQKILVAWLLNQPLRLQQASKEFILRGSRLWSLYHEADVGMTAVWWNLPDGLEHELQYRRECILNTVASIPRHFLGLFSSRERQCKLGYDSSAACDSFQLGQMIKFLVSKHFLFLVDFSPASLESVPDTALLSVEDLITTLKQCPNYQVDSHHTNCGLRIRIEPILDYIRAMLSSSVIPISHAEWKDRRMESSWVMHKDKGTDDDDAPRAFAFTRAMATDQRLRFEGALSADRMAKMLFNADTWDWTPET